MRGPHGEVFSIYPRRIVCNYGRYGRAAYSYYYDEVNSFIYTRILYMNKTKKRRKTQRRRRKQMRGGIQYIGQYTDGVIGTFEFEAISKSDLYYNRKFYEDNIRLFKCPFLDTNDIAVVLDSRIDTKGYALDTGTYRYADGENENARRENKVFFLYFVEPSGFPFIPPTKTMIGFISCSIYRPRNICYVKWECSDASVIKSFVTRSDRKVQKASHALQAFFINYLHSTNITAIYKQLHTYDHPDNGPDEDRGTHTPRYMIAKYNLDTGFQLYTQRQVNDIANLAFLDLRDNHYSKFYISQFNEVHPTLLGQSSEYPTSDNWSDLLKMLEDAKQYENNDEIDKYIVSLRQGGYSHIERLMYMRDLCNMLDMKFSFGKPKPKEETVLPRDKAEKRLDLKAQSLVRKKSK